MAADDLEDVVGHVMFNYVSRLKRATVVPPMSFLFLATARAADTVTTLLGYLTKREVSERARQLKAHIEVRRLPKTRVLPYAGTLIFRNPGPKGYSQNPQHIFWAPIIDRTKPLDGDAPYVHVRSDADAGESASRHAFGTYLGRELAIAFAAAWEAEKKNVVLSIPEMAERPSRTTRVGANTRGTR